MLASSSVRFPIPSSDSAAIKPTGIPMYQLLYAFLAIDLIRSTENSNQPAENPNIFTIRKPNNSSRRSKVYSQRKIKRHKQCNPSNI